MVVSCSITGKLKGGRGAWKLLLIRFLAIVVSCWRHFISSLLVGVISRGSMSPE